jgi:hypothetical protein
MKKKIILALVILLTILSNLALTSCTQDLFTYFPEGIWDEYE